MACQEVSCSLLPRPLGLPVSRNAVADRDPTQRIIRPTCRVNDHTKYLDYTVCRLKFEKLSLLEIVYILVPPFFIYCVLVKK